MNALNKFSDRASWNGTLFPALRPVDDERRLVSGFCCNPALDADGRAKTLTQARQVAVKARRSSAMMSAEKIMAIYKLSTAEGRMIMELAEALLRVPDETTRDFLIFDKLAPGHWLAGDARGFLRGMETALAMASGMSGTARPTASGLSLSNLRISPAGTWPSITYPAMSPV